MRLHVLLVAAGILALAGFVVTARLPVGQAPVHIYLPNSPIIEEIDKRLSPTTAAEPVLSGMKLLIPSLGVEAPVEQLGAQQNGQLTTPAVWQDAGWYTMTARPGSTGTSIIVGHVDSHTGPAVFYRLHELRAGDRLTVQLGPDLLTFQVVASANYPESSPKLAEIFNATVEKRLDLLTCSGDFNRTTQRYNDRLIVETKLVA